MYANLNFGSQVVNLTEENHKAVILAIMAVVASAITGGDAKKSGEIVTSFLAFHPKTEIPETGKKEDIETARKAYQTELEKYNSRMDAMQLEVADNAKVVKNFSARQLQSLAKEYANCDASIDWLGERGGKRGTKVTEVVTADSLFQD